MTLRLNVYIYIYTWYILAITFTFQPNSKEVYPQRSRGQAMVTSVVPFLPSIEFMIPTARRFSSNVANSRSRTLSHSILTKEEVPTNVRSLGLEATKLILIGTRTTYQATGGPGYICRCCGACGYMKVVCSLLFLGRRARSSYVLVSLG